MLAGEKLGRYEISRKIGSGGMGEVFLAHDEQLDRNVALKVLLPEFCSEDQRVKRFKFEAKTVSALNHPGIITIHEIVEEGDRLFIATEYVDGATLRKRIEARDLTLFDSIRISEQVADALDAAHHADIVHRDVKPENIMVRHDGYTKVLDFGLAKPKLFKHSGTEDETIQMVKTQPGIVMGSVRYMSPEQARGRETDERTDIWSLGVVLYEMITGENPFEGETISDSLAALIHKEPELSEEVPESIRRIIAKCLRKDIDKRYQDIKAVANDLKEIRLNFERESSSLKASDFSKTTSLPLQDTSENKTLIHRTLSGENTADLGAGENRTRVNTISRGIGFRALPLLTLLLATVVAAGAWFYLPGLISNEATNFDSIQVSRLTSEGKAHAAAVSPDGRLVAYLDTQDSKPRMLVRQIATASNVEVVPASDKAFMQPIFSPDGEFIYYVIVDKGVGTLYKVSTLGGDSTEIALDVDSTPTFSPDGKQIAFLRHDPADGGDTVYIADNDGKELRPFIKTKEVGFDKFTEIVWTNDPNKILLAGKKSAAELDQTVSLIVADVNDKSIALPEKLNPFNEGGWRTARGIRWLGDESGILFVGKKSVDETRQIWHLSFDEGRIKPVTTDTSDYGSLSISADGKTLIADKVDRISGLHSYTPKTRETKQILSESKNFLGYMGVHQLADGKILYSKLTGNEVNIFLMDVDGGNERQLTKGNKFNIHATATPDGKYVLFVSNREGAFGIWRMNTDGSDPTQLTRIENAKDMHPQVVNDGKTVYFVRQRNDGGKASLMKVSIDGGDPTHLKPDSKTSDVALSASPDGKSVAYIAIEYDREAKKLNTPIKIESLEGENLAEELSQIEFDLERRYSWAPDGKSLTYIKRDGAANLYSMSIQSKKETPITNFGSGNLLNFSWSNDGKSILLVRGIMNSDLVLIKENGNQQN